MMNEYRTSEGRCCDCCGAARALVMFYTPSLFDDSINVVGRCIDCTARYFGGDLAGHLKSSKKGN